MTRTGSTTVRFIDGRERTLPIHGVRQLQVLSILDELGVKNWTELNNPEENKASLQAIRFMTKVTAIALSFSGQEVWTVERIRESFADAEQIAKVFTKCLELSDLPKAPNTGKPSIQVQKHGPYA